MIPIKRGKLPTSILEKVIEAARIGGGYNEPGGEAECSATCRADYHAESSESSPAHTEGYGNHGRPDHHPHKEVHPAQAHLQISSAYFIRNYTLRPDLIQISMSNVDYGNRG